LKVVIASNDESGENVSTHFAHSTFFIIFDVTDKKHINKSKVKNPYLEGHKPKVIPDFVKSIGADVLITGGIGPMAVKILEDYNIKVVIGVSGKVDEIIIKYLDGKLESNNNQCSHD